MIGSLLLFSQIVYGPLPVQYDRPPVIQYDLAPAQYDYDGALIISVETSASLPDWTRPRSPVPAIEPPPVAVPGRVFSSPIIKQPVRNTVERVISIPQQVFSAPMQRYNPPQINADNCVGGT